MRRLAIIALLVAAASCSPQPADSLPSSPFAVMSDNRPWGVAGGQLAILLHQPTKRCFVTYNGNGSSIIEVSPEVCK